MTIERDQKKKLLLTRKSSNLSSFVSRNVLLILVLHFVHDCYHPHMQVYFAVDPVIFDTTVLVFVQNMVKIGCMRARFPPPPIYCLDRAFTQQHLKDRIPIQCILLLCDDAIICSVRELYHTQNVFRALTHNSTKPIYWCCLVISYLTQDGSELL